jgi:diadenosine tetraphosphate (Ap4A) HIT family hydrolase
MKEEKCLFCDPKILADGFLEESENFILRLNMNPVSPGHILIISKKHYSCFGAMPKELYDEYEEFSKKAKSKIRNNFSKPISVEQGIYGQTIAHAHTHIIPSVSEIYDFSEKTFIECAPKQVEITIARGLEDISRVYNEKGKYVSVEQNNKLHVIHPENHKSINIRGFVARQTGLDWLVNWKTMDEQQTRKVRKWVGQTIKVLKD